LIEDDSHEMPYGDMVHRATHAVGEAERALNDRYVSTNLSVYCVYEYMTTLLYRLLLMCVMVS